MTTNTLVTLWHYEKSGEKLVKSIYEAHYCMKRSIERNRITEKGFYCTDVCIVRIPSRKEIGVSTGDYILIGEHSGEMPDRRSAMRITEVYDNRCGTSPHFKIVAGG